MDKSEIIKKVAPCSLMCHTCSAYNDGIICASAKTLLKYLEGIKEFYEVHMPDAVESYNNFEGVLSIYAGASCSGCRSTEHNQQIREYGIEAFWKNNSENPHYRPYKK